MRQIRLKGGGVVMVIALIAALIAIFGARGSANAQEDENSIAPADVTRVDLQVNEDDTCWELAETYTGSGLRCKELVDANPGRLQWNNGEDVGLSAGKFYWLPTSWIIPFLESESADRTHYFERYVRPSTDPGETTKLPVTGVANLEPHNCDGWWPADTHCEGGDRTIKTALLVLIAVIVVGGIFVYIRRRRDPHWPFS